MRDVVRKMLAITRSFWLGLREWCGDAAYERYQRAVVRNKITHTATPEQFYVEQLERRYSRPSRCC